MEVRKPIKKKFSFTQTLVAPPQLVFPLLCPVKEMDWVPHWEPEVVISESGVIEQDCIFIMQDEPQNSVWYVSFFDSENYIIQFVKVVPDYLLTKIDIMLSPDLDIRTKAHISYEYMAINEAGVKFVNDLTDDKYLQFMKNWEKALNHYLTTGEMMPNH